MKMNKTKIALTLGILCFILTLAISVQIKTMKAADSVVSITTANNELKNQVLIWKEKYEKALHEYETLEDALSDALKVNNKRDELNKRDGLGLTGEVKILILNPNWKKIFS